MLPLYVLFSGRSQRVQKSGSFNELPLFTQRLSFLRSLPHILRFREPVCIYFPWCSRPERTLESGSGRVCRAHLNLLANAILEVAELVPGMGFGTAVGPPQPRMAPSHPSP